jgi:two-component system, NtrC family, response regulator
MKPSLLIIDDDEEIRTQMKWALANEYEVHMAEAPAAAIEAFKTHRPPVVLLDLGLPPNPNGPDLGFSVLSTMLNVDPFVKVIIVSGQSEKENTLRAIGAGAYDFLGKPIDVDTVKPLLDRAFYLANLEKEYRQIQASQQSEVFENMVGVSSQMRGLFTALRKVAASTAPVLLLGESGTGKEMAALAVHRRSARSGGPFVPVNCSAIPENLIESELFGNEKGAFTGADTQRKGLVETAQGGTLFLDEIGELPPPVQVKLLRFLQEHRFQRVGGRQELQSDARIVAATNVDLKAAMKAGRFREDLYFRIAVVTVSLPPLRDRGDDIPLIAREFLQRYGAQNGRTDLAFAPDTLHAIQRYPWPGNVRELQNRVQRAVIMAEGKRILVEDLELTEAIEGMPPVTLKEAREELEREMVRQALKRNSGKISAAANDLGVSRPTLYELMGKLGIERFEERKSC